MPTFKSYGKEALCATSVNCICRSADGRRKRSLIDDKAEPATAPFNQLLGGSPSKLMRFHDALLYRRRLAEYYANCTQPTFPLISPQLRRPVQSYDPKLFSPARLGSPPTADGSVTAAGPPTVGVYGASQSTTSPMTGGDDHVATEQPVPPPSTPLLGALFSYLHPSLAAAAAAAMAHWYLGGTGPRSPAAVDPLLTQRGAVHVPDWAVRLRIEDLLRARSAAAAAATSQASSLSAAAGHYVGPDEGRWVRVASDEVQSQQTHQKASSDTSPSTSTDVPFRPYLPDVRRPTQSSDQCRSPDVERAAVPWDRADAASSGSKTPDGDTGSGESVSGGGVEETDGRSSSELVNMERMVHGLKHVQSAAIEKLSKVADSYWQLFRLTLSNELWDWVGLFVCLSASRILWHFEMGIYLDTANSRLAFFGGSSKVAHFAIVVVIPITYWRYNSGVGVILYGYRNMSVYEQRKRLGHGGQNTSESFEFGRIWGTGCQNGLADWELSWTVATLLM